MSTPDLSELGNLHANTAEEENQLIIPDGTMFPPSDHHNDEVQVAALADIARQGAVFAGRVFSGDVSNKFGSAYWELNKLRLKKEMEDARLRGLDSEKIATDALNPNQRKATSVNLDGEEVQIDVGNLNIYGSGDEITSKSSLLQFGEIIPARISDEAKVNEAYIPHITIGDAEVDRILAARLENSPTMKDGMIAGIRAVGKAGDDKIPDEGNVRAILSQFGEEIEGQLAKKSPKQLETITLQQTRDMADLLGIDGDALKANFMGGLQVDHSQPGQLAAQLVAGKNLLLKEVAILDKLTDEAMATGMGPGRDAVYLAWRQQAELVAQLQMAFKGTQTDIARALSALRVSNQVDRSAINLDVAKLLDNVGGPETMEKAIEAYSMGGDVVDRLELAKALTKKSTKADAIYEVWINGILSGYWSHVKNIAGGVAMILGDNAETFGAASMQVLTKGLRGQTRDVTFGDVQAKMFGQFMAVKEAMMSAGKAAVYREDPNFLGLSSKFDTNQAGMQGGPDAFSAAGMQYEGNFGKAIDVIGSVLTGFRIPMRALQAEDAFFKVVSYRGSLYEEAYRIARQEGLSGDPLSTRVANLVFAPSEQMVAKAQNLSKDVTLQTEMVGNWKKVQNLMRGKARWLVPFYKTPTNALLYVGERSPFAWRTNRYKAAMEEGGAAAAKANARWAMGSAAFTTLAFQFDSDNITGGISSDPRVRAAYERQGIKPYSVKIGNEWINYNTFEPVATIVGIVSDAMEIIKHPHTDENTALEVVAGVTGAIGYNMTNKTFLAGISKFLMAIQDPQKRSVSLMKQYLGSALPGSAMWNEIRKLNNDLKRVKKDILDPMKAKLPGFSETLGIKRDLWGRPISEVRFRSPYKPNPMDKEIARLRLPISDHPDDYDADIEFTIKERDYFHETAGNLAQIYVTKMMKTKEFKTNQAASIATGNALAREEIKALFNDSIKDAREDAMAMLRNHPKLGPGLNARIAERDAEIQKEVDKYNTIKARGY